MFDKELFTEIREYIEEHRYESKVYSPNLVFSEAVTDNELTTYIENERQPRFNELLFGFIDQKGVRDTDIYKKAGLDRRHFSKIRSNPDYQPSKNTVVALAIALQLKTPDYNRLLNAAGYSLSFSSKFDLILRFFLEKEIYDLETVNRTLIYFSQKPLSH